MSNNPLRLGAIWVTYTLIAALAVFLSFGGVRIVRIYSSFTKVQGEVISTKPFQHGEMIVRYEIRGRSYIRTTAGYLSPGSSQVPLYVADSDPTLLSIEPPAEALRNLMFITLLGGLVFGTIVRRRLSSQALAVSKIQQLLSSPRIVLSGALAGCLLGGITAFMTGKMQNGLQILAPFGLLVMWIYCLRKGRGCIWKDLFTSLPFAIGMVLLAIGVLSFARLPKGSFW